MNSMSSLKDVDRKIQYVLRKSFDSLPFENHKKLFLDIACFFVGENKDMVTVLREDLNANSGIRTLINRCLLSVSSETGELMMHHLLQDMGRKIVCEESIDPSGRSRVWHDDAYRVLRKGDGSTTIEGLALDMRNIKQGVESQNYAKSRWCLDELCLILEQKRKFGDFVLPVFYHVDPSDVRNHRGSFSVKGSKGTVDDARRWKAALTEVANLSGMELSGSEIHFIAGVIDTIKSELETRHTNG
ncbi:hypothetical protein M8C21_012315 [Ambrosia artemisiifolia]|uniref:TIR domain-containing protein n=1 Tax=Ambrosia artemisiifolia TaxID=4212 RepID=A0AAD5DDL4_AMBAR|nr:hypothetical protein M8C21_012315 [Ambrosia artemisiifolia]